SARSNNRGANDGVTVACIRARIDRNRMLEEIGVSSHYSHGSDCAIRLDQRKVPLGLCRTGRKKAEPVLSASDSQLRLNLSIYNELVAAGRIDHFISPLSI